MSERARIVILVTSPRVPAGCLSAPAWDALRAGAVCTDDPEHPQLPALAAAGIAADVFPVDTPRDELARLVAERASVARPVVWLAAADGDERAAQALAATLGADPAYEIELLPGSWDVPGARLLDAVAVMDRLRSPGGCPWDAEQTHESLGRYLLEEAYEAYETIEDRDYGALREEIGDVLLQVLFHARVAAERAADDLDGAGWTIDDVAGGLVDKLIRRHPHVFADTAVAGAEDVQRNWDALKAAEKASGTSVTHGVALGQPALSLAAKLQKRAADAGLPADLLAAALSAAPTTAAAVATAASAVEEHPEDPAGEIGELLFAVVALAREHHVDAEAALRGHARRFRERFTAVEDDLRAAGLEPGSAREPEWRERW